MKTSSIKTLTLVAGASTLAGVALASTDYGPAVWYPSSCTKYYTSGYGKKFYVIHVMEGYYHTLISWQNDCSHSVSVHYAYNSVKQSSGDPYAAREIAQLVRDANYAWHARCWNQHSMGTEHEGFASNPAWWTDTLYQDSASLTASKATKYGFAKDRNHIVGHNEKSSAAWCTWAEANLGIDAHCNTHSDPGPYWSWSKYMSYVNPVTKQTVTVDNSNAGFSCSANWATGTMSTDKYGADYRYRSTDAVSDQATYTASLTGGTYKALCYYPQGSNRCTTTPYIISTSGGDQTVHVNQQAAGGTWVTLGTWGMGAGANTIKISCWQATGYIVVADAVRWAQQ